MTHGRSISGLRNVRFWPKADLRWTRQQPNRRSGYRWGYPAKLHLEALLANNHLGRRVGGGALRQDPSKQIQDRPREADVPP